MSSRLLNLLKIARNYRPWNLNVIFLWPVESVRRRQACECGLAGRGLLLKAHYQLLRALEGICVPKRCATDPLGRPPRRGRSSSVSFGFVLVAICCKNYAFDNYKPASACALPDAPTATGRREAPRWFEG